MANHRQEDKQMFRKGKMGLATKLYGAFGAVVLLAGVIGFVGWRGVSQMHKHSDTYADWSQVDLLLNEDVVQKILRLERALAVCGEREDEASLAGLGTAIAEAEDGLKKWAGLVGKHAEVKSLADDAAAFLADFRTRSQPFAAALRDERNQRSEWTRRADAALEGLERAMADVIDPAKAAASKAKDIAELRRWADIDMKMNEHVIANVLKLRAASERYAHDHTAQEWQAVVAAQTAAQDGLAEWQKLIADEKALAAAAANAGTELAAYADASQKFHEDVKAVAAAERELIEAAEKLIGRVETGMETIVDPAREEALETMNAAQTTASTLTLAFFVVGVVFGGGLAYGITRGITRPVNRIVLTLTGGAEQTASAASQVSSASQSLAQGSSEQAASVEETTSSIEEMASMIKQNASNATKARELASGARGSAEHGAEAMFRMSQAIVDIKQSADETSEIMKTIDEIAFQTNLLALNAAVEAARAGEAGKSFAVVAEEVRNLAGRSAEAAKLTAERIQQSVSNSENGVRICQEVDAALREISDGSRQVDDLVGEIAAACEEQSQGIEQINTAIGQMDTVTQQTAANAEESAAAAEEMSAQAEELARTVSELEALIGGAAGGSESSVTPMTRSHAEAAHCYAAAIQQRRAAQSNADGSFPALDERAGRANGSHSTSPRELIPMGDESQSVMSRF
jgi:methyl-accepting chemotaxis protein